MRYLVLGAGAVGCVIGGRLFEHGHDVVLMARGPHLDALRQYGLTLASPEGEVTLAVPAVAAVAEARLSPGDTVVLTVKSQDTEAALTALAAEAPPGISLACAQNGVANEPAALRRFERVYGVCVMLPAAMPEPGVVEAHGAPRNGILDLGRFPLGVDDRAERLAADLRSAGFAAEALDDVMRWKYAKLLMNVGNAVEAACGRVEGDDELHRRARAEAVACYEAAGIGFTSAEEDRSRRDGVLAITPIAGRPRAGGSTWQSLARRTGATEVDWLNGEIVLLGRLHGVPTPVNELLRRTVHDLAARQAAPGSVAVGDLLRELA
jgi:2-dehydropantoate 2-reductase